MTEIEELTDTHVLFVGVDNVALVLDAVFNHVLKLIADRRCFELVKEGLVVDDTVFYNLGTAVGEDIFGQSIERRVVTDDERGLIERADEIFTLGNVDSRLAADRRVDHSKQGRRYLNKLHSAKIGRRAKSRKIADNTAAECKNAIGARYLVFCKEGEKRKIIFGAF